MVGSLCEIFYGHEKSIERLRRDPPFLSTGYNCSAPTNEYDNDQNRTRVEISLFLEDKISSAKVQYVVSRQSSTAEEKQNKRKSKRNFRPIRCNAKRKRDREICNIDKYFVRLTILVTSIEYELLAYFLRLNSIRSRICANLPLTRRQSAAFEKQKRKFFRNLFSLNYLFGFRRFLALSLFQTDDPFSITSISFRALRINTDGYICHVTFDSLQSSRIVATCFCLCFFCFRFCERSGRRLKRTAISVQFRD